MGDANQFDFVLAHRDRVAEPILEIGAKNYGNTQNFRSAFPSARYLGVDQEAGPGVDRVCDFTLEFATLQRQLGIERFGTVLCLSVLEHCRDPFRMAANITRFLEPGGVAFLSVPFVWNIHGYPDDYWRFTPSALRVLFPDCELDEKVSHYATKLRGERYPLDADMREIGRRASEPPPLRWLQKLRLTRKRYTYLMVPVMVNALLVARADPTRPVTTADG